METVNFVVITFRRKKFFQIKTTDKNLLLYRLSASWFGGERCLNKCVIKRNGKIIDTGYISHEGTHAASQFFSGFKKIYIKEPFLKSFIKYMYLEPENFELGDVLEIENAPGEFLQYYKDDNEFIEYAAEREGFAKKRWLAPLIVKRLIVTADYNRYS